MKNFETKAHGKWILSGEHSVLRGCPALVFPLISRTLSLKYRYGDSDLQLRLIGEHGQELHLLFWGVLERACQLKGISRAELKGELIIDNNIPLGAGMGASAAFCVCISHWLMDLGYVSAEEIYEFSRQLENLFHGESSGVDIAVALSARPLIFKRGGRGENFQTSWNPHFYISYSGQRGVTVDCVNKVKSLITANPSLGEKIDGEMRRASDICLQALLSNSSERFSNLEAGIDLGARCFREWGLTEGEPERHMQWLLKQGAASVKPTGSGGGGYVLSLWENEPPKSIQDQLISCF